MRQTLDCCRVEFSWPADEEESRDAHDENSQQGFIRRLRAEVSYRHFPPIPNHQTMDHEINRKAIGMNFFALIVNAAVKSAIDNIVVERRFLRVMRHMAAMVVSVFMANHKAHHGAEYLDVKRLLLLNRRGAKISGNFRLPT